ncbi:replication factor C subunit 2 [Dichotomocladium elegans]|nr:replication factor C subunit 2 [Dichotomocladium elegans]
MLSPSFKQEKKKLLINQKKKSRPKTIDDIASQEQVVRVLKKSMTSENLPHLLFYGPPGTGKTSTVLALARQLYGQNECRPSLYKSRVLELNASDERGIQIVREKVKTFSRAAVTAKVDGYPCPQYKLVILDEADSMTKDAQSALRRTMETYSKTTRFCIICNYVSRIIEPITSRCAKFRFKSLPVSDLTARIEEISRLENVALGKGVMDALIKASNGDLRKAITYLQSASVLHVGETIKPATINELAGVVPEETIEKIIHACESNDDMIIQNTALSVANEGYAADTLILQLMNAFVTSEIISTKQKIEISQCLGVADQNLVHGADGHLQILNVMTSTATILATH